MWQFILELFEKPVVGVLVGAIVTYIFGFIREKMEHSRKMKLMFLDIKFKEYKRQ